MIMRSISSRSTSIPIPNNTSKASACPAGCTNHEPEQNEALEQQLRYDLATWRMYELITNHRNSNRNGGSIEEASFCVFCQPTHSKPIVPSQNNDRNNMVQMNCQQVEAVVTSDDQALLDGEVFPLDL